MDRESQLHIISQALAVIEQQPVPNQCVPDINIQATSWLWHTPEGGTTIVRVEYSESQREQDGPIVGLRVPLASVFVRHKGESIPLSEDEGPTHLLSFNTSIPYRLTAVAGLVDAFSEALSVSLKV